MLFDQLWISSFTMVHCTRNFWLSLRTAVICGDRDLTLLGNLTLYELPNHILNELTQTQNNRSFMFSHVWILESDFLFMFLNLKVLWNLGNFSIYLGSFSINLYDLSILLTCIDCSYVFIDLVFSCIDILICLCISCLVNIFVITSLGLLQNS